MLNMNAFFLSESEDNKMNTIWSTQNNIKITRYPETVVRSGETQFV